MSKISKLIEYFFSATWEGTDSGLDYRKILKAAVNHGDSQILWKVTKAFVGNGLTMEVVAKPSLLWIATDVGHLEMAKFVLKNDSVVDNSSPDGTTAMALAIGHRRPDFANLILQEGRLDLHENVRARFLAKEFLDLFARCEESDTFRRDPKSIELREALQTSIACRDVPLPYGAIKFPQDPM